jgi:hypothetical protein
VGGGETLKEEKEQMNYLQIITPTELELCELFTLGLSTKRDGNRIGHKGSGMKFTLALLHRLGSQLEVQTSALHLHSEIRTQQIRGADQPLIYLVGSEELSIATHIAETAGADTWTEAWFALRELIQNAIDEGGTVQILEAGCQRATPGHPWTVLTVPLTEPLQAAWNNRETWWHDRHPEVTYSALQGTGLYFHGFRVFEGEGWKWSYDVTDLISRDKLSEDRQLRNVNLDTLFGKIAEKPIWPLFYEMILQTPGRDLPTDVGYLLQAIYRQISSSNPNPGGFQMAHLVERFKARHGDRVAYSNYQDENSPENYFAKAAGYTPIYVDYQLRHLLGYSDIPSAAHVMPALEKRLEPVRSIGDDVRSRLKEALRITRKLRPEAPRCAWSRKVMPAIAWKLLPGRCQNAMRS